MNRNDIILGLGDILPSENIKKFWVMGTNALLGSFEEYQLPEAARGSLDVDAFLVPDSLNLGEYIFNKYGINSKFHKKHGFYFDSVEENSAVLPAGWKDRVILLENHLSVEIFCLERHDVCIAKLVRSELRDWDLVRSLLDARMISLETLLERADGLDNKELRAYEGGKGAKVISKKYLIRRIRKILV